MVLLVRAPNSIAPPGNQYERDMQTMQTFLHDFTSDDITDALDNLDLSVFDDIMDQNQRKQKYLQQIVLIMVLMCSVK